MATVTYNLIDIGADRNIDPANLGDKGAPKIVAGSDGNVLITYDSAVGVDVKGAILNPDGSLTNSPFTINTTTAGNQFESQSALLKDGSFVTVYGDATGSVVSPHIKLTGPNGAGIKADFAIPAAPQPQFDAHVAALSDGGFVVTWTKLFGADLDTRAQMYNADGSLRGNVIVVDSSNDLSTSNASVTGLAGGGFVTAWTQQPVAGGTSSIITQRYDANGNPLGEHILFKQTGSVNANVHMVALPDGGLAMAYEDNGWADGAGRDISMRIFDADGSLRSGLIRVNADGLDASSNTGDTIGEQTQATLTVLSNGAIAVGWTTPHVGSQHDINARVFDAQGHALTGIVAIAHNAEDETGVSLAGLKNGLLGTAFTSDAGPNDPSKVTYHEFELARSTIGNDTSEILKGDDLFDSISGKGGADKLFGFGGNDQLFGDAGNDTLDGGTGADFMRGGAENDTYIVDNAFDGVVELAGEGIDTVKSSISQ